MKKSQRIAKKSLSLMLSVLMVVSTFIFAVPSLTAKAATPGTYYYKVTFEITDDMDNCQMRWSLTGKTNNGTGTETPMASGGWTSDKNTGKKTYTLMEGTSAAGVFPTKVTLTDNNGAKYWISGRSIGGYIHLYAGPNSSNLTEIYLNGSIARNEVDKLECGSGNGAWFYWNVRVNVITGKANYFTVNYTAGNNMPYINTVTVASNSQQSATVPASGTAYSSSQTSATVKDQYGVVWYQDASWAVNSSNSAVTSSASMTGISAGTGQVNVTNAAKDYLGSSTSKTIYLNAYCGSVKSATIAVAITNINYTVKFYDTNRSTVLKTQTVSHKNAATAPSPNPIKAYDSTYHYTWAGWDQTYNSVTSDLNIYPTFNAVNHTYTSTVKTPATCTVKGTTTYTCTCGYTYDSQDIALAAHVFTAKDTSATYLKSEATCTAPAVYYYKCANCTAKGTTTYSYGSSLGHSFTKQDQSQLASVATCTAAATYYYTCSRCNAKGTTTYSYGTALGHSWNSGSVTTQPTCTGTGVKTYTCTRTGCTATRTETVDALGHNFNGAAHDNGDGTHSYKCARCNTYGKNIDNVPTVDGSDTCTYGDWSTITDATCVLKGSKHRFCSVCNHEETSPINAYQHDFTSKTVTNDYLKSAATCTEAAVYYYKCSRCNEKSGDDKTYTNGAALGHAQGSAATCTEAQTCTRCGAVITPALGHNFKPQEIPTAEYLKSSATCILPAFYYAKCTRCSEKDTTQAYPYGDILPHSYTGTIKDNGNGTHSKLCVNGCEQYGATADCTYGSFTVIKEASETEKGSKEKTCSVCGHKITEEIALKPIAISFIGTTTDTEQSTYDQTITVPANDEATFICWNSANDGSGTEYQPGDEVSVKKLYDGKTLNIYAQYAEEKPIVYDFGLPFNKDITAQKPTSADTPTDSGDALGVAGFKGSTLGTAKTSSYSKENGAWVSNKAVPASNVMFEETALSYANATATQASWDVGDPSGSQTISTDNVYGYSTAEAYAGGNEEYSDGKAALATPNKDKKLSSNVTFTFTGTGFDLISACNSTTGIITAKVTNATTKKSVKTYMIDTYYSEGDLKQVPILHLDGLTHGDYTVQINAMYMPSCGAAKAKPNASAGLTEEQEAEAVKLDILAELDEMGYEIDDPDELELLWCDENSVLNGGAGNTASANAASNRGAGASNGTTNADGSVNCYIDGVRIYEPIEGNDCEAYPDTEKGAEYVNIINNISNSELKENTVAYVEYKLSADSDSFTDMRDEKHAATVITQENYQQNGPQNEVYLTHVDNAEKTHGIAFNLYGFNAASSKVMVSFRAVNGTAKPKINTKGLPIGTETTNEDSSITYGGELTSATEMYYDITEQIKGDAVNGSVTVVIENVGTGMLAVNNVKLVNCHFGTAPAQSPARLRSMMMAPITLASVPAPEPEVTEPEVTEPEITEPEITEPEVTEPEITEPDVTEPVTEPTTEPEAPTEPEKQEEEKPAVIQFFIDLMNKIKAFFRKLFK